MIESKAKILSNTPLTQDVFKMELETEIATLAKPGQFVQITVPNFYLRRPISVTCLDVIVVSSVYIVL